MKKILVTGGAGYIGSHFCKLLAKKGFIPVVVDNLSRGHQDFVRWGPFYCCDIRDADILSKIMQKEKPDLIAHFAGFAYVNESVQNPEMYFNNNIYGTAQLIKAAKYCGVDKILFSSSCAVYGSPLASKNIQTRVETGIHEETLLAPINPYGYSKLIGEKILGEFVAEKPDARKVIALRYFNAAGADSEGELGPIHHPETRIIPLTLRAALDPEYVLSVFGDSHQSSDGYCVRDFIHVEDLVKAHLLAVQAMLTVSLDCNSYFKAYNVGTGNGYSILQLIQMVEKIAGKKVKFKITSANTAESAVLIADATKINKELGFLVSQSGLESIIKSAMDWYLKHKMNILK